MIKLREAKQSEIGRQNFGSRSSSIGRTVIAWSWGPMATHGHGMNHVVKLYFIAKHTLVQKMQKVNYIKYVYKYVGEDP